MIQCVLENGVGSRVSPGVRRTSSPSGPVIAYAMSASPRLSMAIRVVISVTTLNEICFTLGVLRQ
jgi:hypothetical protein